jgi:hypothetical protein
MSEKNILNKIQLLASQLGHRLLRNNVGFANIEGRVIKYGLGVGIHDLIGWATITITPDMVGKKVAVFLSHETKFKKTPASPQQKKWDEIVTKSGGISLIERFQTDDITSTKLKQTIIEFKGV